MSLPDSHKSPGAQRGGPQRARTGRPATDFVAGLVLAAGGSSRLGRPKQTLPYDGTTLLGHVLDSARACGFDQLLVTLGGGADEVREAGDLSGSTAGAERADGEGRSSSVTAPPRP